MAAISGFVNVTAKTLPILLLYPNYQNMINGTETSNLIIMWKNYTDYFIKKNFFTEDIIFENKEYVHKLDGFVSFNFQMKTRTEYRDRVNQRMSM